MVTLKIEDNWGASDTCMATVTVVDETPPVVSCSPKHVTVEEGTVVYLGAGVSDNCDPSLTIEWSHSTPAVFPVGTTVVTATATDASGNIGSDTATVTVIGKDPVAVLEPDETTVWGNIFTTCGYFTDLGSSTDLGDVPWTVMVDYGDGSVEPALEHWGYGFCLYHTYTTDGTYSVTATVTDDDGNTGSDTIEVTIIAEVAQVENPFDPIDPGGTVTGIINVDLETDQLNIVSSWLGNDVVMNLFSPSERLIDHNTIAPDIIHETGTTFESYTIINPEAGQWTVNLFGADAHALTGSFTVKVQEIQLKPAEFAVSDLVISLEEVEEGEEVAISVSVTNIGEEEGSYNLEIEIDGVVTEMTEVALGGGESTTVTFTERGAIGEHTVGIEDLSGRFTVKPEPSFWDKYGLIIVVGLLAVNVIIILWYARARRF